MPSPKPTDKQQVAMLERALVLLDRVNELLDQAYLAHCKTAGVEP